MSWRPEARPGTLRVRATLLAATRNFLNGRGILEVETPMLVARGVTDPQVQNLVAGRPGRTTLHLHSSPEYHMKRLLAAGAPDIWQLCKVFRDGEAGRRHSPEFTLVEWYRRGFTLQQMADECCALLAALAGASGATPDRAAGWDSPVTVTYQGLFRSAFGVDALAADAGELAAVARNALGEAVDASLAAGLGSDRDLWLDLLVSHLVSEQLAAVPVAVVTGYPASQAALARLDPADARVAERFEVFCHGIEVANGYRELTDAAEQSRRFAADRAIRRRRGLPDREPDEELLAALAHGLPDCSGVAVGFDRVVMVLLGLGSIRESLSFLPAAP